MAQRTQKTIAAHPGGILRTEFMEPMRIAAYQLAKALHLPGRNLRDRARTAGDHRGPRPAPLLRWLGWICADSRPPPRQILRDDAAVLDEPSVTSSCLCKNPEGAGFPFQVEALEDGVDDAIHALHVHEADHGPSAAPYFH